MDEGISGKNLTERPAIQDLIADIERGEVQNVLVFKIDRLTRSTADLIYLTELFNQQNCAFNSLTESIDTQTASGRMFLKIIGIFAEFERENIIERVKVGIERKIREGYVIGGHTSYGYEREKGEKIQTINEQEAEIVREIFDMYVNQGVSITDIARRLNVRKISTKKEGAWEATSIRRLLANCNYIGNVRHHVHHENEYSVEGRHEPIINQELYDSAQKLLENTRKVTPRKVPRENNYFSGFLKCGICNYKLDTRNVYDTLKDGTKTVSGHYRCSRKAVRACTAGDMSHKKVEHAFNEYISQIEDLNIADEIEIEAQKKQENSEQIKAYQLKYQQMETKERETMALYVNNEIEFDSYREIKKMVDKEKTVIDGELAKLQEAVEETTINKADIIHSFRENWSLLSASERRQALLKSIQKISVISEKAQGEHYGKVKILGIDFLPSHEKQRAEQSKKIVPIHTIITI
jgi:site-specific DNA recombinase